MDIQTVKQRFGIIGNSPALNNALSIAVRVAPTDLTVLILGESGAGKEVFSQVIHALSARKHQNLIAVNCGAIPEGTIDSELFGHEKGSFAGAADTRKGYFAPKHPSKAFARPRNRRVYTRRLVETTTYRCARYCSYQRKPCRSST